MSVGMPGENLLCVCAHSNFSAFDISRKVVKQQLDCKRFMEQCNKVMGSEDMKRNDNKRIHRKQCILKVFNYKKTKTQDRRVNQLSEKTCLLLFFCLLFNITKGSSIYRIG